MKAPNITPGVWLVRDDGSLGSVDSENRVSVAQAQEVSVTDRLFGSPERKRNATAIAAVPDLIEALNDVHELIVEAVLTGFNPQDGNWANRLFESQYKTITALKKAGCTDE